MHAARVFVVIEKDIKKKDTIVQPQEYLEIFSQHGAVVKLSSAGCPVYDWRSVTERALLKPGSWHFKFVPSKRFIVYKCKSGAIKVRGEGNYRSDMCVPKNVLKSDDTLSPDIVPPRNPINSAKLRDVRQLLTKHFGNGWENIPELLFYKNLSDDLLNERGEEILCQHNIEEDEDVLKVR